MINPLLLGVVFFLASLWPACSAAKSFFTATPLRSVYEALADNHPRRAYQELSLALNKGQLDPSGKHWTKAGEIILEQTQCGRQLVNASADGSHLRVTYSIQSNPRRQFTYQILVSSLGKHESLDFEFMDVKDHPWFSGSLPASETAATYKSPEWLAPFPSGAYTLRVNQTNRYSIFIAPEGNKDWLDPWSRTGKMGVRLPAQMKGCPPVTLAQSWLDKDYNALAPPVFLNKQDAITLPTNPPDGALWYSAAVSLFYYHGGIQIEFQQRATIPVTWLPKKQGKNDIEMTKLKYKTSK